MNRDEKRARAKGLPPSKRKIQSRTVVYPSEPGGGTWIALNDRGAAFALINWYSVPARVTSHTVSRGEIIPFLGTADAPGMVTAGLAALPLDRINPFRLIGVFPACRKIAEWRWDLKQLVRKNRRWRAQQWVSSGFDEPAAQKVRSRTFKRFRAQRSAGTLGWLRRLHRSHFPERGPFSTCMHREGAATVSYTEVYVFENQGRMWHTCGTPCSNGERSRPTPLNLW